MRTEVRHPLGGWFLAVLWVALLAACSYNDGAFRQVSGLFFDARAVKNIVDGKTTEKELVVWLGPPVSTTAAADGGVVLHYHSIRSRTAVERRLWWRTEHSQTIEEELVVEVASDIVVAHNYQSHITEQ